jgi:hypothetical protein
LPPTLPETVVVPDDLDDEPPPQPATKTDTTASHMTHLNRFIDILRSPFLDDRQLFTGSIYS